MGWLWKTKSDLELLRIFEGELIECLEEMYLHAKDTGSTLKQKKEIFEELYYPCLAGTVIDDLNELDKFKIPYSKLSNDNTKRKYVAKLVRYKAKKLGIKNWNDTKLLNPPF